MTILLTILKLIGIILLLVIGILLLAILLICFLPVSYSLCGEIEDEVRIKGKIHWLFHVFTLHFSWEDNELVSDFFLFGMRKKKKEKLDAQELIDFDEAEDEKEYTSSPDEEQSTSQDKAPFVPRKEKPKQKKPKQKKQAGLVWRIKDKIKHIIDNVKRFLKNLLQLVRTMKEHTAQVKAMLADEANQQSMRGLFGEILYLLKHFGIRKMTSNLSFSMGDPAWTGQVLGGLCVLPFLYQKGVEIYPDFDSEEFYVRGWLKISGHARGIHVIVSTIKLWSDKNFRKLVKTLIKK